MSRTSSNKKRKQSKGSVAGSSSQNKAKNLVRNTFGKTKNTPETKIDKRDNSKKANFYFILFFFVFALALYGNTVLNKWSVDDNFVTGPQNELVKKGFAAIPKIFTSYYVDTKGNAGSQQTDYRPIVKMTFAIENGFWGGQKPGRSHLINVLLYFWISTLLFFILRRLLKNYNILFPFLITLFFMAHPVHTEVVASLKNRDELLAFLCGLGGLHFLLRYAERKKIIYFIATLIVFFIGYLCKSSIVTFAALYPLVLYFFTDIKLKKFIWIFTAVFIVGLMAYFIPRLFLPKAVHVYSFVENPLFENKSIWVSTGAAAMTLFFYLKILIFPHPLLYYYGYNMIPVDGWGHILAPISLIIHLGIFIYALKKFREKHILSFAILYYFIAISMFANIAAPVVGIVGERFAFNASLGFIIVLVYFIFMVFHTEPRSLTIEFSERAKILVIIGLLLIPCTAITIKRNREWRNLYDLYTTDTPFLANSFKANVKYAEFMAGIVYQDPNYQQNGAVNERLQQTIVSHFRNALKIYPDDYTTLNDLATVYINFTSKPDSALVFLKRAIALKPELQPAWVNMALAYYKVNKIDSALACYEQVLQINPKELIAVFKMVELFFEKGEVAKAMKINDDLMKKYPNLDVPYFSDGYYFLTQGDTTTAIKYWEQAAQRNPGYEVCTNLGYLFKTKGDIEKSTYYYSLAVDAQQRRNAVTNH
ncbi:MAG: tetratricopeptide repeat protein [Bacteroidales bacterium]|jgi:tetratricopeptide (TPR) repeat protein